MMPTTADTRAAQRAERIDLIVSAATVRERLGVWARYRRLADGRHEVTYRGVVFVGKTLDEAIRAAGGSP